MFFDMLVIMGSNDLGRRIISISMLDPKFSITKNILIPIENWMTLKRNWQFRR